MHKKVLALILSMSILLFAFSGCDNQPPTSTSSMQTSNQEENASSMQSSSKESVSSASLTEDSSAQNSNSQTPTRYQITKDLYIEPIPATKPGDKMSDEEIDTMARNLFKQCSIVYSYLLTNLETLIDHNVSIQYQNEKWYKVNYIKDFSYYQNAVESVFSKKYYDDHVCDLIKYNFIEYKNKLWLISGHGGDIGGYMQLIPNKNKVVVISKESGKIVVKANLKGVIYKGYDDLWVDGDLIYTFMKQNNNWVLEDFNGEKPE